MFHPIGGMEQIPKAFARAIGPSRITFNAEVQAVRQDDHAATVPYMTRRQDGCTRSAPDTMAAVRATTYSNSAKVGLAMKRRFWEEDDQIFAESWQSRPATIESGRQITTKSGGHLDSNLPIGEFSYPSTGYFSRNGVLLGL